MEVVSVPYCGIPGYGIFPIGLSSSGDVVGSWNSCAGGGGTFSWTGEPPINFITIGADNSGIGTAINSTLQIVGTKIGLIGHVGFLYENGKTIDIGMLPGSNFAEAYAINQSGHVCGYAVDVNGTDGQRAFLWADGSLSEITTPRGPHCVANNLNDNTQVVGWMGPSATREAFIWDNGKTMALGVPPTGVSSEAKAISNNGYVCGVFSYANPKGGPIIRRALLWYEGIMNDLGILPGYLRSLALDVNNSGIVVGYCSNNLPSHAFVWRNGIMSDLNDSIAPELDLELSIAVAINDNGQILCSARDENSSNVAVLLTPIPSPIGDLNCNGSVDVDDLLGVINTWADQTPKGSSAMPPADFSHNHIVDVDDLLIVINNWTE